MTPQETLVTPGQQQACTVATSGIRQTLTVFMGNLVLSQLTTVSGPQTSTDFVVR